MSNVSAFSALALGMTLISSDVLLEADALKLGLCKNGYADSLPGMVLPAEKSMHQRMSDVSKPAVDGLIGVAQGFMSKTRALSDSLMEISRRSSESPATQRPVSEPPVVSRKPARASSSWTPLDEKNFQAYQSEQIRLKKLGAAADDIIARRRSESQKREDAEADAHRMNSNQMRRDLVVRGHDYEYVSRMSDQQVLKYHASGYTRVTGPPSSSSVYHLGSGSGDAGSEVRAGLLPRGCKWDSPQTNEYIYDFIDGSWRYRAMINVFDSRSELLREALSKANRMCFCQSPLP